VTNADSTPRRLFVFARHAESAANIGHVLSTDPSRPTALTERGQAQARALGAQLANVPISLAVCSRLLRTRETVSIALGGRPVPVLTEPGFDEIRAGDLDGEPIQAYWDWLGQHTASDRLPHGESLDDALRRYAGALRGLLARTATVTLVVTHELALRHIAAAAAPPGRPPWPGTDFAHAVPYLFDSRAVRRAAAGFAAEGTPPVNGKPHDPGGDTSQAALQRTREPPTPASHPSAAEGTLGGWLDR
jgi:broad specificity phosphatase PhoE